MTARTRLRLGAALAAEVRKIWASRTPLAFALTTVLVVSAFAFEIYHVEHALEHIPPPDGTKIASMFFFGSWKTLMFPAALVAFCAFWVTVDSQYGMIRVGSLQPLTRAEYLAGRWLALCVYAALFVATYLLTHLAWIAACSGWAGLGMLGLGRLWRFSAEMLTVILALTLIAGATASMRRTVGSGIVTAYLAILGLALMTMLPTHVMPPRLVFMRHFFFPFGELVDPFTDCHDSPFVRVHRPMDFALTMVVTPLAFVVPAALRFCRRDITE